MNGKFKSLTDKINEAQNNNAPMIEVDILLSELEIELLAQDEEDLSAFLAKCILRKYRPDSETLKTLQSRKFVKAIDTVANALVTGFAEAKKDNNKNGQD